MQPEDTKEPMVGLVGAVNTIYHVTEVERACVQRIPFAAGHEPRWIFWRMPCGHLLVRADALAARPGEAFASNADAAAQCFSVTAHRIEKVMRGINDDGPGRL